MEKERKKTEAQIKAHAALTKESVTAFINRAIDETLEQDNLSPSASETQ